MFKILKRMKKREWLYFILTVALITMQVWVDLKLPEYMGSITELLQVPGKGMNDILQEGGKMAGLAFLSVLISILIAMFAARIATNLSSRLRDDLFNKVQSFTLHEINQFSIPSLITRTTNDITQVQMLIVIGMQILVKSPIMAVWAITKILDKSWQWSMATGIAVITLILVSVIVIGFAIPKFKVLQKQTDDLSRVSRENLTGLRVVRAYNAEKYQESKFEKTNLAFTKTNLFANRLMAALMPSVELINNGLILSVYWLGALLISNAVGMRQLELFSDMMVFSSYALQLLMAFMMLVMVLILIPRASVSAQRIGEVLDTKPTIKDGRMTVKYAPNPGEIEFKHVSFKYPDAQDYVLQDITFKANKGETIALIGAIGCGKSTVIDLIPRFYEATEGEITIGGVNIKDYKQASLRDKIGYVSQKAILFKGSVASNVSFGSNGTRGIGTDRIEEAIETSQSQDFVSKMDKSIKSYIAPGGANLSGGQKQRLSIARAIARNPEILIFDDSFSALDYKTDKLLRKELRRQAADATIVIVAQRIGTIKDADKIIVLDQGKIAGIGKHKDLLKNCSVYQEIAYSQLSKEELENE